VFRNEVGFDIDRHREGAATEAEPDDHDDHEPLQQHPDHMLDHDGEDDHDDHGPWPPDEFEEDWGWQHEDDCGLLREDHRHPQGRFGNYIYRGL
jgi:hypothetical protein